MSDDFNLTIQVPVTQPSVRATITQPSLSAVIPQTQLNVIAVTGPQGLVGPAGSGALDLTGQYPIFYDAGSGVVGIVSGYYITFPDLTGASGALVAQISSAAAGVNAINGLSGFITLAAVNPLFVSAQGQTLYISGSGLATSGDLTSVYSAIAQTGASLYSLITGNTGAAGLSTGVTSLNGATGAVQLTGAGSVVVSRAGQVIIISGDSSGDAAYLNKVTSTPQSVQSSVSFASPTHYSGNLTIYDNRSSTYVYVDAINSVDITGRAMLDGAFLTYEYASGDVSINDYQGIDFRNLSLWLESSEDGIVLEGRSRTLSGDWHAAGTGTNPNSLVVKSGLWSLSGYTNYLYGNNLVYRTGDQLISGIKAFSTGIHVSGEGVYFDTPANPAWQEGLTFYDQTEHALSYYNDANDVTVNIGQEMLVRVTNKSSVDIFDGQAVFVSGAQGNRPKIWLAVASGVSSENIIGVVTHDIPDNQNGYVTTQGIVRGIDMSAFTEGDPVYLSPTVPGGFTNVIPQSPNIIVKIGTVLNNSATIGSLYVDPEIIASHLAYLHDVRINTGTLAQGDLLSYDATGRYWTNVQNPSGALATGIAATGSSLYTLLTGASGDLGQRIFLTGAAAINYATTYANSVGVNTSGTFSASGASLQGQIDNLSQGTASQTWQLQTGSSGNLIKNTPSGFILRNYMDTQTADLTVYNLTVEGTQFINNTTNLGVANQYIYLNISGAPQDGGIVFLRSGDPASTLLWNESVERWQAGLSGTESTIILASDTGQFASKTQLTSTGLALGTKIDALSGFVGQVSGGLETRIAQTGAAAVVYATSVGSTISGNLTQTGATLIAYVNGVGQTLSGNLTQTGATLQARINSLSGFVAQVSGGLETRIAQTGAAAVAYTNTVGSIISGDLTATGQRLTAVRVTGSSTLNTVNLIGTGGINVFVSGGNVYVSGTAVRETGISAQFFVTGIPSGASSIYVTYPTGFSVAPVVVTQTLSIYSSVYASTIQNVSASGFNLLLSAPASGANDWFVNVLAVEQNATWVATSGKQLFTSGVPSGASSLYVNYPTSFVTTPVVVTTPQCANETIYLSTIQNVSQTGFNVVFAAPVTGSGELRLNVYAVESGNYFGTTNVFGGVNGATNLGAGSGLYAGSLFGTLQFNSIRGAGGVSIIGAAGTYTLSGTNDASGNLVIDKGLRQAYRTISANATVSETDNTIYCANTTPITLTFPSSNVVSGMSLRVKLLNTGSVTLTGATSGAFDGSPSYVMVGRYAARELHAYGWDGSAYQWFIW